MNLTLNDFRNILGKVNDGDVVFTRNDNELTGIEKANYGKLYTRHIRHPSNADNERMRKLFAESICNSAKAGKTLLSEATLANIRQRLGIVDGADIQHDLIGRPLERREIKAILEIVDGSCEQIKVDNEKAVAWIKNGAQPTDTVRVLLKKSGAIEG